MAIKRKHAAHENHERWLVSYADFITLLFAFFVVMFASSQTDKAKAKQMAQSIEAAFEGPPSGGVQARVAKVLGGTVDDIGQGNAMMRGPGGAQRSPKEGQQEIAELTPSLQTLTKELQQEIKDGKLVISLQPRGLVVSIREAAYFPSGEDTVAPKLRAVLGNISKTLLSMGNPVRLEGHTDSVPIKTARFPSNWDLASARAIGVLRVLADEFGVDKTRLAVAGYGDTIPVDSNETAEGRAHNRRVDLVILNRYAMVNSAEPAAAHAKAKPSPAH